MTYSPENTIDGITIETMEATYMSILTEEDLEYALPFSIAMSNPNLFNAVLDANRKIIDCEMAFDRVKTILENTHEEKIKKYDKRRI